MRRQDELLAIYPTGDLLVRKFILAQVEGLALAFDSEELLEFLQGERGSGNEVIRQQALHALLSFLPSFIQKRYSMAEQLRGVWTDHEAAASPQALQPKPQADATKPAEDRSLTKLFLVKSLAKALLKVARTSSGRIKNEARVSLAQFPLKSINAELWIDYLRGEDDFEAALACAFTTSGDEDAHRLALSIAGHCSRSAGMLLMLSRLPTARGFDALIDLAPRVDMLGRINLALALSKMKGVDVARAIDVLTRPGEGWVIAHCLRVLESSGDPAHLDRVRRVYESSAHAFLKSQAVRAAGGIPSQNSIDFCLAALDSEHGVVKAQALESLVRLRCQADTLRAVASPLMTDASLRTRVNAILACAQPDDDRTESPVADLLLSTDPISRVEAAYCLGYLQSRRALTCLITLGECDPCVQVRTQAIKSLSKYPAPMSGRPLLSFLLAPEPRVALTAARVLTRYVGEQASLLCERLTTALKAATGVFEKALIYRALGTLAGKTGYGPALPTLAAGLDEHEPLVLKGVVEGWISLGGLGTEAVGRRLKELAASQGGKLAPRIQLALFTGGDISALDALASMLESGELATVEAALETALEAALLVASPNLTDRFPALSSVLDSTQASDAFVEFRKVDDLTLRPAPLPGSKRMAGKKLREEGEFQVRRVMLRPTSAPGEAERAAPEPTGAEPPAPAAPRARAPVSAAVPVPVAGTPRPPRATSPSGSGEDGGAAIDRLKRHLTDLQAVKESATQFVERLWEVTYLVDRLQTPAFWQKLSDYRMLAVPIVAFLVVVIVVSSATLRKVKPAPTVSSAALSVGQAAGTAVETKGKVARALASRQTIEAGTRITTNEHSAITLLARSGNQILMRSSSNLVVESIKGLAPDLAVVLEKGYYAFEWRKPGKLEIEYGQFRFRAERAVFSMEQYRGKFSLIVDQGQVEVDEVGHKPLMVEKATIRALE